LPDGTEPAGSVSKKAGLRPEFSFISTPGEVLATRSLTDMPTQLRTGHNSRNEKRKVEPTSIMTSDGVVPGANMNSLPEDDASMHNPVRRKHVLSFMDYDNADGAPSSLAEQIRQSLDTAADKFRPNPDIRQIDVSPSLPTREDESGVSKTKENTESEPDISENTSNSGVDPLREFTIICPPVLAQHQNTPTTTTQTRTETEEEQLVDGSMELEVNRTPIKLRRSVSSPAVIYTKPPADST
jgi:hypothetical protein